MSAVEPAGIYDEVVAALEGAAEGGEALDIMIACLAGGAAGAAPRAVRLLAEEGFSWEAIGQVCCGEVPAYSTSLDAALPGEAIAFVMRSARRGGWAAMHVSPSGEETLAWAASEALARRLAALKGLAAEGRLAAEASSAAGDDGDDASDWKILF